ncbi:MAG: MarR family transcriptional regulator, partial [Acidobacteria bacterium]|nr:MarR family transcriptional regulator [Acidobacteriota bacterium]
MSTSLLERYKNQIRGVISCYDRVIIQGTLPGLCYAEGMASYLARNGIRLFDYPRWAEPFREKIRTNAEAVAQKNGLTIEFIRKIDSFRKEDRIQEILVSRGTRPGLVHIFSAMEACSSYQPWHDKKTHKTFLKPDGGKCLHYYFYFIDSQFGLCYLRVPTWCPFRLQFYFNGHNWLAARLKKKGMAFQLLDNAFTEIADFDRAQGLADELDVQTLHKALKHFALAYCPVFKTFGVDYHWSLMQVEYATDVVFKKAEDLKPLYDSWVRTAIHAVKAEQVATFLGRKLHGNFQGETGNHFHTRIEGTRIKHHMGPTALKMYDKFGSVLRLETTTNDVSFFKHHRTVEQPDGQRVFKLAPLKKSIYS